MIDIANLFITCVKDCVWVPLSDWYVDFSNFDENLRALADNVESLEARKKDVEESIKLAESKDEVIKSEVRLWQERVEKVSKELAAFHDQIHEEKRCIGGCFPDCHRRYKLSKEAKEKASYVRTEFLDNARFDSVSLPRVRPAPEFVRTPTMERFQLFPSTKAAMNKVMESMRRDEVRVVGVYGMGGVGKTTLVKEAAKRAVDEGLFDHVVFTTVSQNDQDLKRIQRQIAEVFRIPLGENQIEEQRAALIHDKIMREKRVLIILDDLWRTLDLSKVGVPHGIDHLERCNSKILLTTRLENVCHRMDCKEKINLLHLSEPDSWNLFKTASRTNFDSTEFETIGKLVAKESGFALKEWPNKQPYYESCTAISFMCNEIPILPDGLNCPRLQTLLLQDNNKITDIPSKFFEMMNELRVLDLSAIQATSLPTSIKILKNLRTLHLDRCKFTDVSVLGELEKLEILSLKESLIEELPDKMGRLSNLRMLDLTLSYNIKRIPPNLISRLFYLEELYLQGSFAQWQEGMEGTSNRNACFEELLNLRSLTIVKIDIADVRCLPRNVSRTPNWLKFDICVCRTTFTRMMNVHLSKRSSVYTRNLLLDIMMKNLPDWFIGAVSKKAEKLLYSECTALNMLEEYYQGSLSGLKCLSVDQCPEVYHLIHLVDDTPGSKPIFESLEELRIHQMDFMVDICDGELPTGSLENLKFLEVQQCNYLVNALLPSHLIKRLRNLETIRVSGNSVEEVFGFEKLEEGLYLGRLKEMRLDRLAKLTNIWKGPARRADFTNLKFVTVIKCKKLKNLFSVSISEGLLQLEDLWVEDCLIMEDIIRNEEGVTLEKVTLPQLKTLCLQNLPLLSRFYVGNALLECPSLEHLHVQNCPNFNAPVSEFQSTKKVLENDQQHMKHLKTRTRMMRS
ncbi:hypothetical protein TIFTF001_039040 [Ficus carica]|uniref:AAA+ ATPase domain-containing protein n=1 Tax=Ficus carica TaxID=3494 RepID=A0AA88JDP0_FICCA|nr:hypothetical protein TIFTF001_039040 [Ficus carica]